LFKREGQGNWFVAVPILSRSMSWEEGGRGGGGMETEHHRYFTFHFEFESGDKGKKKGVFQRKVFHLLSLVQKTRKREEEMFKVKYVYIYVIWDVEKERGMGDR